MTRKKYRDPYTGDQLTFSEMMSWNIQGVIRRWAFIGSITVATIICWTIDTPRVLLWWNFAASYSALLIESVVGIAVFGQMRRDAQVVRDSARIIQEIRKYEAEDAAAHRTGLSVDIETHRLIAEILARLDRMENPVVETKPTEG